MKKLNLAIQLISGICLPKELSKFEIESKEVVISYYKDKQSLFEKVTIEQVRDHDFSNEVRTKAKNLKRYDILNKNVKGLERHTYAPELNKLHFINGQSISVSGKTTIEEAIKTIESNPLTIERLTKKKIIVN